VDELRVRGEKGKGKDPRRSLRPGERKGVEKENEKTGERETTQREKKRGRSVVTIRLKGRKYVFVGNMGQQRVKEKEEDTI